MNNQTTPQFSTDPIGFTLKQLSDFSKPKIQFNAVENKKLEIPIKTYEELLKGIGADNESVKTYNLKDRDVSIKQSDLNSIAPILFSEISNRGVSKKKLEATTIINTAINRMKEYSLKGQNKTIEEILKMPNQYQGYNSKEYKKYVSGNMDKLDSDKKNEILSILSEINSEMENGSFKDNIGGNVYYTHNKQGQIYSKSGKLFK